MIRRRALGLLPIVPSALAAEADWLAALRRGGFVLYMRHGVTDRSQVDTGRLWDRPGQRNLAPAGVAQVQALSAAVERLGIPIGLVRSSPVYRASDTATLMARGAAVEVTMELVADDYTADVPAAIATLRAALARPPAAGTNTLLVGHIYPVGAALGRTFSQQELPEGAIAVVAPGSAGGFAFIRVVTPDALLEAARGGR